MKSPLGPLLIIRGHSYQGAITIQWQNQRTPWCLSYWVGQKVRSGLSVRSYGKTQTKFLADPIVSKRLKTIH